MRELKIEWDDLRKMAEDYAKAKSIRVAIEVGKKTKEAELMKSALISDPVGCKTLAAQQREARANPQFRQMIKGLEEAVRVEESCKWKLEIAKMQFGEWQTLNANDRVGI